MKRINTFFALASLCLLLAACSAARERFDFAPLINNRTDAVVDISEISRSTTEFPDDVEITAPVYFEVVATSTTAPVTTRKPPAVTDAPKEFYTVKFVDIDGYSAISVQNVEEGAGAKEPPMPERRNDMIFVGWDKDFSRVTGSMIVKAVYQKEWLNVYFYGPDSTLLKSEVVFYGDDATPPKVVAPNGYEFEGWSKSYKNVTSDLYIYAKFKEIEKDDFLLLKDAYNTLPLIENVAGFPKEEYCRKTYNGNTLYGNFSDVIDISDHKYAKFKGTVSLSVNDASYSIALSIYLNEKHMFRAELTSPDTKKEFSLDLTGVSTIKIQLQTYKNGSPYIGSDFVGGIVDAVLYEK